MARKVKGLYKRGTVWWCAYKSIAGKIVRVSTKHSDYEDAIEFLTERKFNVQKEIEEPELSKIINYAFRDLATKYDEWSVRQRGYDKKRYFIKDLVNIFGDYQVKNFNTLIVENFQNQRLQRGNKPASVNRIVGVLKHCLHKGLEWDMVGESVYKKVARVKPLEMNNKRLRYLSVEECHSLIDSCDPHLRPIVVFALNSGCRKGEILSLKWESIDLKHGFILLDRTKNGDRREIPINTTLRITLEALPRRLDGGYAFYDPKTRERYLNVKRSFATALRRAGIKDFHFHDLRHCFASHLVMNGVDLTTVSKLLGHKSLAMTLRYSLLSPQHMSKAVDILDGVLNDRSTSHLLHNPQILRATNVR
jgi:integrase